METNPAKRVASAIASMLACLLLIGLFMVQLRYLGFESGVVPVAHAGATMPSAPASTSPRTTITAEYCSEVVATSDPSNPSGRTSTRLTFDDAWFFRDSHRYEHELATACSVLAAVCNSESQYYDGVAGSIPYAEQTLGLLGFEDVRTDSYALRSSVLDEVGSLLVGSSDVAAYTLASKTIAAKDGSEPHTLIFVGIRGTYGTEWLSNFNFREKSAEDPDHRGFKTAEEEVEEAVRSYAREQSADPARTRILITGHSRGGGIANLLAANLNRASGADAVAPASGIYAYTFAAPGSTRAEDRHDPSYRNIFNVINEADIVTQLPLSAWGFGRYGETVALPSATSDSFDDSYATVQTAYERNTGATLDCDEGALASLHSFGSNASAHVPTAESLSSPLGVLGVAQAFIGVDVFAALDAHYPDTYIAWMQAGATVQREAPHSK